MLGTDDENHLASEQTHAPNPEDSNSALLRGNDRVSRFRFYPHNGEPTRIAFFHDGTVKQDIAERINNDSLSSETHPPFRERLTRQFETPPHRNRALYAEFDGIIFEQSGGETGRIRVYLSAATRELDLVVGNLTEISRLSETIHRLGAGNDTQKQEAEVEMRSRETIALDTLETGRSVTLSWYPPAVIQQALEGQAGGRGQAAGQCHIRYERSSGKVIVTDLIASLTITPNGFPISISSSATFPRLEGVRGPLERKPLYVP